MLATDALDATKLDDHLVIRLLALLLAVAKVPNGAALLDPSETSNILSRALSTDRPLRVACVAFALARHLLPHIVENTEASEVRFQPSALPIFPHTRSLVRFRISHSPFPVSFGFVAKCER